MAINTTRGFEADPGTRADATDRRANEGISDRPLPIATTLERCGSDVARLVDQPSAIVGTLFGTGFRTVRVRNAISVAGLDDGRLAFRAEGNAGEISRGRSTIDFAAGDWRAVFLRIGAADERSLVTAYDDSGRPSLEFVLDRRDLEDFADFLPQLEHHDQRPCPDLIPEHISRTILRTEVDEANLVRDWRRESAYDHITKIARVFRLDRRQMFESLPARWTAPIEAETVSAAVDRLGSCDLPGVFELFTSSSEATVRPRRLETCGGRVAVSAEGRGQRIVADLQDVEAAFIVRKPCHNGLATALELFDGHNDLALRVRLASGADLDDRMVWRASLPSGRVCPG